jgi:hypothetical protein
LGTVSKNFFKKVVRHMNNKRKMKKKKGGERVGSG